MQRLNIINVLLHFKYSMKLLTLNLAVCLLSYAYVPASNYSLLFQFLCNYTTVLIYLGNFIYIDCKSAFYLYLWVRTIWYLHIHFVYESESAFSPLKSPHVHIMLSVYISYICVSFLRNVNVLNFVYPTFINQMVSLNHKVWRIPFSTCL